MTVRGGSECGVGDAACFQVTLDNLVRTLNVQCMAGNGEPETLQVSWNDCVALTMSTSPGPHSPRICGATVTDRNTNRFVLNILSIYST